VPAGGRYWRRRGCAPSLALAPAATVVVDARCGGGHVTGPFRLQVLPLPTAAKHDLSAQKLQVSMPEVRKPQVRHRRSELHQQIEVVVVAGGW
jgi:hypothetical protein